MCQSVAIGGGQWWMCAMSGNSFSLTNYVLENPYRINCVIIAFTIYLVRGIADQILTHNVISVLRTDMYVCRCIQHETAPKQFMFIVFSFVSCSLVFLQIIGCEVL